MNEDESAVLSGVGARLRALRRRRGMTLTELAEQTGLTASTLSRLETGRLLPTLSQLLPLARAFRVPLDDLVAAPATGDPRVHLTPIHRFGLVFIPLNRGGAGGLQAFKVLHPPAPPQHLPSPKVHEGYEWCYVLAGRIRLVLGELDTVIETGDAVEFDTHTAHWLGNADRHRPAELLMLFGPHGERAHVAAVTG